jgi:hypothetical protein
LKAKLVSVVEHVSLAVVEDRAVRNALRIALIAALTAAAKSFGA